MSSVPSVVKCFFRQTLQNRIQQVVDAASMLGGDRKHFLDAEPMKIVNQRRLFLGVDFVDRQEERPVRLAQQAHQFKIRARQVRCVRRQP